MPWFLGLPGPCITNVIATCRKNFSQWESSFLWKLRCHWLKFLRPVAKTLVIQGPVLGPQQPWYWLCRNDEPLSSRNAGMMSHCLPGMLEWWAIVFQKCRNDEPLSSMRKDFLCVDSGPEEFSSFWWLKKKKKKGMFRDKQVNTHDRWNKGSLCCPVISNHCNGLTMQEWWNIVFNELGFQPVPGPS